jgi:hypothetical protein
LTLSACDTNKIIWRIFNQYSIICNFQELLVVKTILKKAKSKDNGILDRPDKTEVDIPLVSEEDLRPTHCRIHLDMQGNRESRQPIGQEDAVENNVIHIVLPVPPIHLTRLLQAPPLNAQDEDGNEIKAPRTSK